MRTDYVFDYRLDTMRLRTGHPGEWLHKWDHVVHLKVFHCWACSFQPTDGVTTFVCIILCTYTYIYKYMYIKSFSRLYWHTCTYYIIDSCVQASATCYMQYIVYPRPFGAWTYLVHVLTCVHDSGGVKNVSLIHFPQTVKTWRSSQYEK